MNWCSNIFYHKCSIISMSLFLPAAPNSTGIGVSAGEIRRDFFFLTTPFFNSDAIDTGAGQFFWDNRTIILTRLQVWCVFLEEQVQGIGGLFLITDTSSGTKDDKTGILNAKVQGGSCWEEAAHFIHSETD